MDRTTITSKLVIAQVFPRINRWRGKCRIVWNSRVCKNGCPRQLEWKSQGGLRETLKYPWWCLTMSGRTACHHRVGTERLRAAYQLREWVTYWPRVQLRLRQGRSTWDPSHPKLWLQPICRGQVGWLQTLGLLHLTFRTSPRSSITSLRLYKTNLSINLNAIVLLNPLCLQRSPSSTWGSWPIVRSTSSIFHLKTSRHYLNQSEWYRSKDTKRMQQI